MAIEKTDVVTCIASGLERIPMTSHGPTDRNWCDSTKGSEFNALLARPLSNRQAVSHVRQDTDEEPH